MTALNVRLHCNGGGRYGLGHVMRCVALAQEASARGWRVRLGGDLSPRAVQSVAALCPAAEVETVAAGAIGPWLAAAGADVLHLDSYWLRPDDRPRGGPLVSGLRDDPWGTPGDLTIHPTLGAETAAGPPLGGVELFGVDYALVRRQILDRRQSPTVEREGVLVVVGGTDPQGLAPRLAAGLLRLAPELALTVVASGAGAGPLRDLAADHPRLRLLPFVDDLAAWSQRAALVVTAAGTTVWDLAALGTPLALVATADNQLAGYRAAVRAGLALGLSLDPAPPDHRGEPPDLSAGLDQAVAALTQPERLARLGARGRELVDGLGAWRVVSAWEQLVRTGVSGGPEAGLTVRPVGHQDAELLLAWRNHPATRLASRSTGVIPWSQHREWLEAVLADPEQHRLVIVQRGPQAVGTVRWRRLGARHWEVSLTVAPPCRGQGLGAAVLLAGQAALPRQGLTRLEAVIRHDNIASQKTFAKAGYLPFRPADAAGLTSAVAWRRLD